MLNQMDQTNLTKQTNNQIKKANLIMMVCFLTLMTFLAGCDMGGPASSNSVTKGIMAMDTLMEFNVTGKEAQQAVDESEKLIYDLDSVLSPENEASQVYQINSENNRRELSDSMSPYLKDLFDESQTLSDFTGGTFDITIRPVIELWGFPKGELTIPDEAQISDAIKDCGRDKITVSGGSVILEENTKVDFGAITKGYAADEIVKIFDKYDLQGACVSLGGNILCYGQKADGSKFRIAIENPDENSSQPYLGSVYVTDCVISTSSGSQRYLVDEETGKRYIHIIDPRTGYPVDGDIKSVTVISKKGYLADAMSTACFVMGLKDCIDFYEDVSKSHSEDYEIIILAKDDSLYVSKGLEGVFDTDMNIKYI